MQLKLPFAPIPEPHARLWEDLDRKTRTAVLERLVEMMARTVGVPTDTEDTTDD